MAISADKLARFGQSPKGVLEPGNGFEMDEYLAEQGFVVTQRKPWSSHPGGQIYELQVCPFNPDHVAGSATFTLKDGKPGFRCQHAGCLGKAVRDVFALYPPKSSNVKASRRPQVLPRSMSSGEAAPTRFHSLTEDVNDSSTSHPGSCPASIFPFLIEDQGISFMKEHSDGSLQPIRISARIDVIAKTRNEGGEDWGRLISWRDQEGRIHQWPMPMEALASDFSVVRSRLLSGGLAFITSNPRSRERLEEYLQGAPVTRYIRCVPRVGWSGDTYVLPDEAIGPVGSEEILHQPVHDAIHNWRQRGTLAEWRENIGEPCSGNSRLIISVSCSFAGPILQIIGAESGGIHFHGASSTGKSTALLIGGSVCGGGGVKGFVRSWSTTINGLEAVAEAHNDATLFLDELAQVDPRAAAETAYLLGNGQGKARMTRSIGSRKRLMWNLLFVSSGELTMAEHSATVGKKVRAGVDVRLINIEADAGREMGILENLHGAASSEVVIERLRDAASKYYGTPIRAFLRRITNNPAEAVRAFQAARAVLYQCIPPSASGEVKRVTDRFALIAAAGQLATEFGLTGWKDNEALDACRQGLNEWIKCRGTIGSSDSSSAIRQIRAFLEAHGASRFQQLGRNGDGIEANRPVVRAGFRRLDENSDTEFLILRETFRNELCSGFSYQAVVKELDRLGFLIRKGKEMMIKPRLPELGTPWVYGIRAAILEGECCLLPNCAGTSRDSRDSLINTGAKVSRLDVPTFLSWDKFCRRNR